MENNKVDQFLNPLQSIEKVDAPPFLFSRILNKIEKEKKETVSGKLIWTLTISFTLLLLLNFITVKKINHSKENKFDLIESFQLDSHNDLYQ